MYESGHSLSARFVLIRRLGAGGGGEVWLAEDRERAAWAAVKILPDALARNGAAIAALERECARMRGLGHPRIVRVDAVHRSAERVWLAMEYVDGGDLTQLRGRSPAQIVRVVQPVAEALADLHRAGVVHRDLKPANVLLTRTGEPRIADFGMALATAAFPEADAGRGSLYTMSPQQLDGAPASPSDDVYGLGAMLYELLTGYPPFYPKATPERIRFESPAPLAAPPELAELVERMLSKSPEARPDMQAVARELLAALAPLDTQAHMSNDKDTGEPIRIMPPGAPSAATGEPLRAEWRRAPHGGASARRGPGARRVLGVAAVTAALAGLAVVFLALPRLIEQEPAPRYAPAASAIKPEAEPEKAPAIDFAALARAKQQADENRAAVEERLTKLTDRGAGQWGAAEHQTAVRELASGDEAYGKREYALAAEHFGRIAPLVDALEKRAGEALKEQLQAGAQAIEAGRSEDARAAFVLAAKIEPDHPAAAQGLKRANALDEVLRLVAAGERLEKEGDVTAAIANFRKALALDPLTARAAAGAARIETRLAGDAFASAMARGYAALASGDHASARAAFEQARRIRPEAPEIAQAMGQIEQEQRTGAIGVKLAKAQELEQSERWADALREYRAIVELDPTIAEANEGVQRTEPRSSLNEQLEMYLTQPERLFSQSVRAAARETLARAAAVPNPGPLLRKQMATLSEWAARADAPVAIALQSDNLTHVTIYRVGELGAFAQRSLELAPGSYTVVGTRPGYRDVRRQINVTPDAPPEPIVIRCEDRI
jgi:eukaryotic-like serine/threonine-protein kinase